MNRTSPTETTANPSSRADAATTDQRWLLGDTVLHQAGAADHAWWRSAVIYQIYPRSWADGNGDGVGDLPGVTARLDYLKDLGVDAIWLSPFYTSPQADAGYDVADYRDVDPVFGSLEDVRALLAKAHGLGLKVIVDLVPNHSSDEHPWFQAALASGPGSPERDRYIFRDGTGPGGAQPPNNWRSVFGGSAWTRVPDGGGPPGAGQWYLHIFDRKQPDLNWDNPEVRAEFEDILRYWLDLGVDGFRVDVAHGLVKEAGLPDWDEQEILGGLPDAGVEELDIHADERGGRPRPPMWDQEGVHEIYQRWRAILDGYGEPARVLCAEAWVQPAERTMRYVRPDEMHQTFNFEFLECPWHAARLRRVIEASLSAAHSVGAPSTWVLSNHDVVRHASRLGLRQDRRRPNGIGKDSPQPDRALGLRRARAATTLMLALPGAAYLYQGEELGLPESTDLPDEYRQDPTFHRTHGLELGRDGCRVPMPWEKDRPGHGFGPSARTWLPQPSEYGDYAVDQQVGVPGSTLELYRSLLVLRRTEALAEGSLRWLEYAGPGQGDLLAFVNERPGRARVLVVANLGPETVPLPAGATVVLRSGELAADGRVPTDTTVWARW